MQAKTSTQTTKTAPAGQPATSFAARAGRWSAQHRRAAIAGWLAAVTASVFMPMNMLSASQSAVGESGAGARAADKAFPQTARETVLIQSTTLRADAPAFKAAVSDVASRLRGAQGVRSIESPYR